MRRGILAAEIHSQLAGSAHIELLLAAALEAKSESTAGLSVAL